MKKINFFVFLFLFQVLFAFGQNLDVLTWAGSSNVGNEEGNAIAHDANNNVYVVGRFIGTLNFNGSSITVTASPNFNNNIFVAKYDANGNLLWAKRAGEGDDAQPWGVAVSSDAVYVTGYFSGTMNFNTPAATGSNELTSAGGADAFLAKYDLNGNFQWARRAGSTQNEASMSKVAVRGNDVYWLGTFLGTANFNTPAATGSNELTSAGGTDIFVAKYNNAGSLQWLRRAGGVFDEFPRGIATGIGGVYVVGDFYDSMNVNGSNTINASNAGGCSSSCSDGFLFRLDFSGGVQWTRRMGGGFADRTYDVKADEFGNVYVTGAFFDVANFNTPAATGSNELTSAGGWDIFVAAYDANSGNYQIGRRAGGSLDDVGQGIALGNNGKVFITGYFKSAIANFNTPSSTGSNEITNSSGSGTADMLVASFTYVNSTTMGFNWARSGGSTADDEGRAITYSTGNERIWATGFYNGTATFSGQDTAPANLRDIFLVRYNECPNVTFNTGTVPTSSLLVGSPISFFVNTNDLTSPTYTISPALPTGLSLNASTGEISGTPLQTISSTIYTITATSGNCQATHSISLTIECPVFNYTPATLPNATFGVAYSQIVQASSPNGLTYNQYTLDLSVGRLPNGLSLNTSTGTISGTPTEAGTFNLKILAGSNSHSCGDAIFYTFVVNCPTVVTFTPTTLSNGNVGSAYSATISSSLGAGTTYSISPALPAGLNLNANTGVISGTPTAVSPATTYTITATNSTGAPNTVACTATQTYTFEIGAPLAINEELSRAFEVYPNPFQNYFEIAVQDRNVQIQSLEVLNIQGQIVAYKPNFEEKFINISALPTGMYLLKIKTQTGEIALKKIVKD
ncbi:putative Ig domain-containing protein [Raineya sp.]